MGSCAGGASVSRVGTRARCVRPPSPYRVAALGSESALGFRALRSERSRRRSSVVGRLAQIHPRRTSTGRRHGGQHGHGAPHHDRQQAAGRVHAAGRAHAVGPAADRGGGRPVGREELRAGELRRKVRLSFYVRGGGGAGGGRRDQYAPPVDRSVIRDGAFFLRPPPPLRPLDRSINKYRCAFSGTSCREAPES